MNMTWIRTVAVAVLLAAGLLLIWVVLGPVLAYQWMRDYGKTRLSGGYCWVKQITLQGGR